MKARTIGSLTLLLIILGIVYYFDYQRETERESAELNESRLIPFAPADADALTIQNPHGVFRMEKRTHGWWLTSPVDDRADQSLIIEKILPELDKARKASPFEYTPPKSAPKNAASQAESYGLAKPSLVLTIGASSKNASTQLTFGAETPVAGESYVVDGSQPNLVYATASKIREHFAHDLPGLRDKTILEFDPAKVVALWVKRTSDTLATRRETNGEWRMDGKAATSTSLHSLADKTMIENLLRRIEGARALGFVTTTSIQPSLYGLDQPAITLEMRAQDATTATHENAAATPVGPLFIGNRVKTKEGDKPLYYAMRRGRDAVFHVSGELVDALRKPLADYGDRRMFSLAADQVGYLQIEAIVSTMAFARDAKGAWHLVTDYAKPIDQEKVNSYIAFCLSLRAEEYPDPPIAKLADVRLDAPALRVTMANAGRKVRQGFEIGATPKGKPFFYARRSPAEALPPGEPTVFLIGLPLEGFYALMRTPDYFFVKKIMVFEAPAVQKITLAFKQDGDKKGLLSLTREKGGTAWKAASDGKSAVVPENQASLLLSTLASFEYEAALKKITEKTLKAADLNPPPYSLRLFDAAGKQLGAVSFGNFGKKEKALVVNGDGLYLLMETKPLTGATQTIDEIMTRLK